MRCPRQAHAHTTLPPRVYRRPSPVTLGISAGYFPSFFTSINLAISGVCTEPRSSYQICLDTGGCAASYAHAHALVTRQCWTLETYTALYTTTNRLLPDSLTHAHAHTYMSHMRAMTLTSEYNGQRILHFSRTVAVRSTAVTRLG
jgi:hypothetical protein